MPKVKCFLCKTETYKRPSQIKIHKNVFCSRECYGKHKSINGSEIRKCAECGKEYKAINGNIKRRITKFCSMKCLRKWQKGNKKSWIGTDGYEHYGNIRKHRIIIEEFIGRKLKKNEVVHHINGIKSDNSIENLKIMTISEHHSLHYKQMERGVDGKLIKK